MCACARGKEKSVPDFHSLWLRTAAISRVRISLLVYKSTLEKLSQVTAQREIQVMLLSPEASPHPQRKDVAGMQKGCLGLSECLGGHS